MSTIFKKIIDREVPADIVYEDAEVLAFLDKSPIRKGHTLVIPKREFENIFDGDEASLAHMIIVAQKVARALLKATDATGVNIKMNNGQTAGQDVFHAHIHVIPRFKSGETFIVPDHESYSEGENTTIAEKIKIALMD